MPIDSSCASCAAASLLANILLWAVAPSPSHDSPPKRWCPARFFGFEYLNLGQIEETDVRCEQRHSSSEGIQQLPWAACCTHPSIHPSSTQPYSHTPPPAHTAHYYCSTQSGHRELFFGIKRHGKNTRKTPFRLQRPRSQEKEREGQKRKKKSPKKRVPCHLETHSGIPRFFGLVSLNNCCSACTSVPALLLRSITTTPKRIPLGLVGSGHIKGLCSNTHSDSGRSQPVRIVCARQKL